EPRPPFDQDPADGQQDAAPEGDGQPPQGGDAAVQECNEDDAQQGAGQPERPHGERQGFPLPLPQPAPPRPLPVELRAAGVQGAGDLGDGYERGGNFQRPAEHELPDEEEGHQPPPAVAAVALQQVQV